MSKASITRKYSLNATGIICEDDSHIVGIENPDSGEFIPLYELLEDFMDKSVKLNVNYDEDYDINAE